MSGARVKKRNEPLKALPFDLLSPPFISSNFSPLTRHISPEHATGPKAFKGKVINQTEKLRRTSSLDALTQNAIPTFLLLDKATQTDETSFNGAAYTPTSSSSIDAILDSPSEIKMHEKVKHRLQTRCRTSTGTEHSVVCATSQTFSLLSPTHSSSSSKASPVLIPRNSNHHHHQTPCLRPMRSSVEGLNQEIEKLVLHPTAIGQVHSCRQELEMFSRGTPEGHRAPITDLFHPVGGGGGGGGGSGEHTRSVNTQTPSGDKSSDSASPDDTMIQSKDASPRINKFLAREPPDGCEKVNLNKQNESDNTDPSKFTLRPCVGFQLRPSLGSAFQPIPIAAKKAADIVKTEE